MSQSILRSQTTQQSLAFEAAGAATKTLEEFDKPEWNKRNEISAGAGTILQRELFAATADQAKQKLKTDLELLKACFEATKIESKANDRQFALLFLYDAFREDSSLYSQCQEILRQSDGHGFFRNLLERNLTQPDPFSADKSAWLLSSIMTNCSYYYTPEDSRAVLNEKIFAEKCKCSDLGKLEATCNLLKSVDFRNTVWGCEGAKQCVLGVSEKTVAGNSPQMLYKYLFALWMLSYDKNIAATLQKDRVVPVLKEIMATCRVEKVIRLGLVVIRSFLPDEKLSLDIVDTSILEVVQQLEFEKWRDLEIYDDIREVSQLVAVQVSALSNFDKYEKQVKDGHLVWGYLHSNKFWGENVNKFEQNEFGVIKDLCTLLQIDNKVTQAVACHDIGEFAVLHPLGKKKLKDFDVKGRVMELMKSEDRDVRREALLCCQKIMLNKWQDASK